MPLKQHPTDPDKMVYASRQYDIPQPQGIPQLQGVTTTHPTQEPEALHEAVISAWSLREVYFDEDGEPSMHRSPPQREWVGLTVEEAAECWTTSATQTWKNFEAKLKDKNNA